jgi:hypothetical protein
MCCWRAMETEGREMRMAHGGRDVERIGLRGHRRSGNIRATIERARNEERGGAAWLTACAAALATGRHAAAQPRHLLQRGRGHGASSTVCIQPTGRGWRLGSAVRSAAQCGSGERILIGGEERERESARPARGSRRPGRVSERWPESGVSVRRLRHDTRARSSTGENHARLSRVFPLALVCAAAACCHTRSVV